MEVIRTADPMDGQPLVIAAKPSAEHTLVGCRVTIPVDDLGGVGVFDVIDDLVFDSNGELVGWMEGWQDDATGTTCGVKIAEKLPVHDDAFGGAFEVRMELGPPGLFGCPSLNILSAKLHIKDELITRISGVKGGEDIRPVHYSLTLVPDLLSTSPTISYYGTMHTDYAVDEDNEGGTISFHMEDLDITSLSGTAGSSDTQKEIVFKEVMFDFQTTIVKLVANESFVAPGALSTDVGFKADELDPSLRQGRGLYKVPCTEGSDKYCWFTQFEPSGARMAFPCRDDPDAKAVFNVAVARTEGWNTLANGPLSESVPMDDKEGWFMETFYGGPPMSTYLVALAIQDFASVEGPNNVTVWASKDEIDEGLGEYSADLGARVLDYYGNTFAFGYNQSLPKMDMVSVPNKGGAMENWGLVLYSKATLMFDQEENDEEKQWRVLEVVAHELAHQWTGNLVTMKWWDETWLNEGFASYISHLGAEAVDPLGAAQSWARLLVHRTHSVMRDDARADSWALSDAVTSRSDVGRKFGSITYSKGASVIRMMESILGRDTLIHGLAIYLNNMQYGSAVEEDLFRDLEAAAILDGVWPQQEGDINDFEKTMKTWTNQAGLPLVTVTRDGNTLLVEQTWYTERDGGQQLWDIPLTGGFEGSWGEITKHDIFWLTEKQATLNIDPEFADIDVVFFNRFGMGYYRVNYDTRTWGLIGDQLATDHLAIPALQRATIICDVADLARNGYVSQETMSMVLAYRELEEDFGPLLAFKECVDSKGSYDAEKDLAF